jgi:hypothetical protein
MSITVWDYHILENPTQVQLTALGRQGWELVSVTCIVSGFSRSEKAFFKRPLGVIPPPLQTPAK